MTDEEIATYGEAGLVAFARKVAQGCGCKQGSGSLIGHMLLADCASDPTEHIPFKKPT